MFICLFHLLDFYMRHNSLAERVSVSPSVYFCIFVGMCVCERERYIYREIKRESERERETQTDRQRQRGREIQRDTERYGVLLINFLPSLPITAERGSVPSAPYPPERATSGIATCSVVGDTYRPVAKLSPASGWWTLPCLACLWARIRARSAKQSTGWRNTVTNV